MGCRRPSPLLGGTLFILSLLAAGCAAALPPAEVAQGPEALALRRHRAGEAVEVLFVRGGEVRRATAVLEERR